MNRLIAATAVVGVIFLAGCGAGGGGTEQSRGSNESITRAETSPASTGSSITSDNRTTPTTPEPSSPDHPPDSTLTYEGQTVTGVFGSYCWGSVCADMAGIPVPPARDRLTVPTGATLAFDFGGTGSYRADLGTYRLDPEAETQPGPDGIRFLMPRVREKNLKTVRADGRAKITADLPAGEYVLSVFVRPDTGDASYFYRLRVKPETGEGSSTSPALAEGILFARQPSEGNGLYPSAAFTGKLVVEDGCLRMKHLDGVGSYLPVWPHDYSLSTEDNDVRLLDGEGQVAARLGDAVRVGGGEIRQSEVGPTPEQARRNYQQTRRKLNIPSSCPGPLWMVADIDGVEVIE